MKTLFILTSFVLALPFAKADNGVDASVDARVRYEANNYDGDPTWYDSINADDINVTLTAQLASKVKAKIRTNLAAFFGPGTLEDQLEKAIEEATIEIRDINGTPVAAVIFGKHQVFGDIANKNMADYKDSLLYNLFTKAKVIGVTVKLKEILGFAIAASAYENSADDLQFGDGWGFSVAVSRQLTQNIRLRGQGMMMQRGSESDFGDRRATVGLVYTNDDGTWSAQVDGLYFDGQTACYLYGKHWAVQAGAQANVGPGKVRVQASYLERTAYEVAAAYDLPVAPGLVVSPTVRYTTDENGNDGHTTAMVETRVRLSSAPGSVK